MIDLLAIAALATWMQGQMELLARIEASGRLLTLAQPVEERLNERPQVPPGTPPILAFRFFEGRDRHRFGKLDLILDDAGH